MWKNMGRARQATDDNMVWRMRFPYLIIEATDTYVLFFRGNSVDAKSAQF